MSFDKRTKQFVFSLLLLLPTATQCMKRAYSAITSDSPTTTIQSLKANRDKLKKRLDDYYHANQYNLITLADKGPSDTFCLTCTYLQHLHKTTCLAALHNNTQTQLTPSMLEQKFFLNFNIDTLKNAGTKYISTLQRARIIVTASGTAASIDTSSYHYSVLGSAILAEQVSCQEKKEFIQKLLALDCKPTPADTNLALLEKMERCIQKIYILRYSPILLQVPDDVITYIYHYVDLIEELLF